MKPIAIISACSILLSIASAADVPEVAAAKARYNSELAGVTKPVRDKYVAELQQIKSRAIEAKNQDLANAVDQELKSVNSETAADASSAKSLTESLRGTTWYAQRKDAAWEQIEFTDDKKMIRTPKKGNPMRNNFAYEAGKDPASLTIKWNDGVISTMQFSKDHAEFRHADATYKRTKLQ